MKYTHVSPNNLYDTTAPLLTEIFTDIAKKNKKDPEVFVGFLDSLCLTLNDYENLYEIVMIGGDSKNPRKIPIQPKVKKAISEFYHTRHTDDQKKTKKLSEVQADYYISKRAKGRFSKASRSRKTRRSIEEEEEEDYDYSFNGEEEEDGDYNPTQTKEKKTAKKEKTAKSQPKSKPKPKSKGKSKKKYSSEDDEDLEDDGSDLDGFIVDDDEYDDADFAPKTKTKKSNKSDYKPKTTVVKKKKDK